MVGRRLACRDAPRLASRSGRPTGPAVVVGEIGPNLESRSIQGHVNTFFSYLPHTADLAGVH